MDSPGSPKDVTKNNYDLVAESVQHVPEVEKFHAGRKNMQLLAERAFHAPNLSHILQIPPSQFPTLPSDKAFAGSTATICIEEDDAGDHDPDLAGYLKQAGAPSKEGLHVPGHGKPGSRQSPWSMLTIPTMGHDGKPMDFGKDLFGRSRNGSPLPFLYSLSRATSPCSFLLGSWYGGPGTNATTTNFAVPEDAPAKLPSRLSSTSIATEGGDAMEAH